MPTPVQEYHARQKEFNARQATAIDGIVADIKSLNDKIVELQNNPGPISPEDQALLNELEAESKAAVERAEALDAQIPPPAPPVP